MSEVYLNRQRVLDSDSMFASYRLEVSAWLRAPGAGNELVICCRALAPLLRPRRRPRARWRTRLVAEGNIRFFRTMLLGRAPGFSPGPACVGPWKPVRLECRRALTVESVRLRASLDGATGRLSVRGRLRTLRAEQALGEVSVELDGPSGTHRTSLAVGPGAGSGSGSGVDVAGELVVPGVEGWWPHTHGNPALHDVRLRVDLGGEEIVSPPAGSAFARCGPSANWSATGSSSRSTTFRCSPEGRYGRRSTSPRHVRAVRSSTGCSTPWSAPA